MTPTETSDQTLLTLRGHDRWVTSVAFSPDSKRILSGSDDETLKVWDSHSGKLLLTVREINSAVTYIIFAYFRGLIGRVMDLQATDKMPCSTRAWRTTRRSTAALWAAVSSSSCSGYMTSCI